MKFDFKETIWCRVTVPDRFEDRLLNAIKAGEIKSVNDIFNNFSDYFDIETEYLDETGEQLTVEENGGAATIEVSKRSGDSFVFENGSIFKNGADA
jgi:hypothetical protein